MGTVKEKVGPLSYMVELPNGMVGKHHIDYIEKEEGVNQNLKLNLIVNRMFVPKNKVIMNKSHLDYPKRHLPLIILLWKTSLMVNGLITCVLFFL